jgi:indolepyruvate ferredoxin oxidoreductase
VDLGRHAVAMSRASGLWVALKIVATVADGVGLVEADPGRVTPAADHGRPFVHQPNARMLQPALSEMERSPEGIHREVAIAYARANGVNRVENFGAAPRTGIVAGGKTYLELRQALRIIGLDEAELSARGMRLLHLGMIHPLIPSEGELDADLIARGLAERLGGPQFPTVDTWRARTTKPRAVTQLPLVARTPYFCSGCPHNSSTKAPAGSMVGGGIGCHALVLMMEPDAVGEVTGLTQMGGEPRQYQRRPAGPSAPASSTNGSASSGSIPARTAPPRSSSSQPTCPPPSSPACSASTSQSPSHGSAPAAETGPATPPTSAAAREQE